MKRLRQLLAIFMTITMLFTGTSLSDFSMFSFAAEDEDNVVVSQEMESPAEDSAQADDMEQKAEDSNQDVQTDQSKDDTESNADADTPASDKDTEDKSASSAGELQTKIKLSDDSKWIVTAVCSDKAGIPENAELVIEEVDKEDTGDYLKGVAKTLKWSEEDQAAYSRFLNISITSKGKTIQPSAEIKITIEADDVSDDVLETVQVVRFGDEKTDKKFKAEEMKCEVTDDDEIIFPTDELAVFGFVALDETGLVHKTLKAKKVRLEGMMPEDAKLAATDASTAKTVRKLEGGEGTTLAAYDITIKADGEEYQPDEAHPIKVRISDKAIKEDSNLTIWHIADDGTKEQVEDFTISNGAVTFEATGFSVYAVIDHEGENGNVLDPRVEFHFIAPLAEDSESTTGADNTVYYTSTKYEFKNKSEDAGNNTQTTQILKNGESLELITDPDNQEDKDFYGWYIVDYSSSEGNNITYSWPANPDKIAFDSPITIQETAEGSGEYEWSLHGISGTGSADSDGNIHVYLAPLYKNYNFVNFMLYAKDVQVTGANTVMTRKLIATGSAGSTEVKISDVRANSEDPVHLIFTGWEYNAGTEANPDWRHYQTVDHTGAEMEDPGKDGVYLDVNLEDRESIDLYPIFIEARWMDFVAGPSGSGAKYVSSRFLESWGRATPDGTEEKEGENVISKLETSTRQGYAFEGWYAFAVTDTNTGEILNLTEPMGVDVSYVDENHVVHSQTINTTAIKIADRNGDIEYNGTYTLPGVSVKLFGATGGKLKFYDGLDRLTLYANWTSGLSHINVVYWTEKEQGKDYVATDDPKDDYTASAVKTLSTKDLSDHISGKTYGSGSEITLEDLKNYIDNGKHILATDYLGEAGAVPENEEKFYDSNDDLSDSSQVINGDGSTTFNVYYSRKTFKLVFHIGRDSYVKNRGHQRTDEEWDRNWIEFMYRDKKVRDLGYQFSWDRTHGRDPGDSYSGVYSMKYNGVTYDSTYVTDNDNVMGDYVPKPDVVTNDQNLYVITAKYGAYIGDRWPTPVNDAFTFTDPATSTHTMYIWAAYYGSLYCRIANERDNYGNANGNNPDINGVYEYMSKELCSNRSGDDIINKNQVHHLVAYYGDKNKPGVIKNYHILFEAIDGTYDPSSVTVESGTDYLGYSQTTWSAEEGDVNAIDGHSFYKVSDSEVISNLEPRFQLGSDLEGYDLVYSCYNSPTTYEHDVYFFYKPKQYTLTFMYENEEDRKTDTYYYTESLANAKKPEYEDPSREGYSFEGWYTNDAGIGKPFDFANETMPNANVVLYPVLKPLQYMVKIDPNGGEIDHRVNGGAQATYFNATYGTPVGEYTVPREYIKLSDKEQDPSDPTYVPEQQRYYYINTQFVGKEHGGHDGDWGYPADLRNALYLTETELRNYFENVYLPIVRTADPTYWTNIDELTYDEFVATYATYPYRKVNTEHYTFMGWYQVHDDGTVDTMPYNFNDPVTGPLELRANWRLDGGYYVEYEDESGSLWHDPENLSEQLYADQALIKIMHAPTNVPAGKVFRGWYVVDPNGEPFQRDEHGDTVYYQPGDNFVIDSALVTEEGNYGKIIHMKAYYESEDETYRRPDITNLILDANQEYGRGYVNTTDSTQLPALAGSGSTSINTKTQTLDTEGKPTQILFGDIQSNLALHLFKYATTDTHDGVTGKDFFDSHKNYRLIGFDENADPDNPTTGSAYIPAFAPDAVAAVTRDDHRTLYAMWEPMIYATFVNTTDEPITINLSGDGASVVNIVTGEDENGREATTGQITVPARSGDVSESVKVVFPAATAGDSITATAVNDHANKKMSVSGTYHGQPYPEGCEHIKYGKPVTYNGELKADKDGIFVTYTEEQDNQVLFDVNDGNWTDPDTGEDQKYYHVDGDLYAIDDYKIVENNYKPTDPTKEGKVFVGWTTNEDIAGHTDFSSETAVTWGGTTITPDAGSNVLDKVKSDYLWDFSLEPPFGQTLYAVWSEAVTVTFDIVRDGNNLHVWTGPATTSTQAPEVYYRSSENSGSITYTLAKGARVPKPEDPTADPSKTGWYFVKWLKNNTNYRNTTKNPSEAGIVNNTYDFSQYITEDITLSTSWTANKPQTFTFKVKNEVVNGNDGDDFTYTIAVSEVKLVGKINGTNQVVEPSTPWGSISTQLKNNEEYTVIATVEYNTASWKGNSVCIEVIDRSGIVIKTGQLMVFGGQSKPNFTSDYRYTLTIKQAEKPGYTTTVGTQDLSGNITFDPPDNETRSFTFISKEYRSTNVANAAATFSPEVNNYCDGTTDNAQGMHSGDNSLTIVFTNTNTVVSPTGYVENTLPFILLLAGGLFLGAWLWCLRRRRSLGELS